MTYKVTDSRGKLSTDSFLRQCNFRRHSKSLRLYMKTVPLIYHQKKLFIQNGDHHRITPLVKIK